jgi:hypothetical protein
MIRILFHVTIQCRKNKDAARVGHPAGPGPPPAHRDKAAMNGAQLLKIPRLFFLAMSGQPADEQG